MTHSDIPARDGMRSDRLAAGIQLALTDALTDAVQRVR